jgi:CheY-like chemotaxis protein
VSADKRDVQDILIVDNEESILALMQRQLMDLPFVIIPTSSPSEAIHLLKTREISVLLCDLMMPGQIDGNQVLSTAREYNPNVVSIVVTGATDPMTIMKAINEGGIWKSMAKPWKREELVQLVQAGVQRYTTLTRQQAQLQKLAREVTRHEKPGTKMETKIPKPKLLKKIFQDDRASSEGAVGVIGGRYKLDEALGEGGMGTVYKAHDLLLNMPVAIKVLGSSFTKNPVAEESLKEEARIAMQLSHRHIVRLHNLQKTGENYFLVMEYVPGRTLWEILTRYGKLPLGTVRQVVQVCSDALSYAHRHGVLHRDLKPANLLLSEDGVLKIIDFGVACLLDAQPEHDRVVGTPVYMSPEHIRGEKLDARTDVYSLGIILHELLTGQTPFPRNASCDEVLEMIPAQLSGLADDLLRVIGKSISPDREERYPTVQAFAAALMDVARSS